MTEEQIYAEIGRRISLLRRWRGINQATLAQRMRMTRVSITNAEAGRQKMPVWNLLQVAEILNVPPHVWLLDMDEWRKWCALAGVTEKRISRRVEIEYQEAA